MDKGDGTVKEREREATDEEDKMSVRFARRSRRVVGEGKKQVTYFMFLYTCVYMFRSTFAYKKYSCLYEEKKQYYFSNRIIAFKKKIK